MALLRETSCCALAHLLTTSRDTLKSIERATGWGYYDDGYNEQTTVFTVTTPREKGLAKKLAKLGFQHVFTFPRREAVGKGNLKLWVRLRKVEEETVTKVKRGRTNNH